MKTIVIYISAICVFDYVSWLPIASGQQAIPECRHVVKLLDHCIHVADRPQILNSGKPTLRSHLLYLLVVIIFLRLFQSHDQWRPVLCDQHLDHLDIRVRANYRVEQLVCCLLRLLTVTAVKCFGLDSLKVYFISDVALKTRGILIEKTLFDEHFQNN